MNGTNYNPNHNPTVTKDTSHEEINTSVDAIIKELNDYPADMKGAILATVMNRLEKLYMEQINDYAASIHKIEQARDDFFRAYEITGKRLSQEEVIIEKER